MIFYNNKEKQVNWYKKDNSSICEEKFLGETTNF
jgi:hypothetical protein